LDTVELHLHEDDHPKHPMEKDAQGYWSLTLDAVKPGTRYTYRLNEEKDRPDPASHFQPDGVHEPSAVVDHSAFQWEDDSWDSIPLQEMVLYEMHIGTFTEQGTFESAIHRLDHLKDLGVNVVDIMPIAQFPGGRNWGYDGVYPFAAQSTYGGPDGFKKFVNACHKRGIAVALDVVYNHLGPEGNYLWDYGPYFTKKYRTPWGEAVNFDGPHSDPVRNYFIDNAIHWFEHYHVDALRLDAVHAIFDNSAKPFLRELAERVEKFSEEQGRQYYLMPESNLNDTRIIRPWETGGYGHHTQWLDDFHHSLHTILTGENDGYYVDFGEMNDLVKCLKEGFVYDWRYSEFRKRRHGNSSVNRPAEQFVAFTQNHDQIGNRMNGERLSQLVPFEATKLAAASLMLAPYIPMLFMGEEHADQAPFLYFVSHNDEHIIEAVREGRKEEFESFEWTGEPPDPQSEETFQRSKLNWHLREEDGHATILEWYKELIALRKSNPAMQQLSKKHSNVDLIADDRGLIIHRWNGDAGIFAILNFQEGVFDAEVGFPEGEWERVLDSSADRWQGQGSRSPETASGSATIDVPAFSAIIYQRTT
jgi:maltooligosyltrehalose trehalohydrolase